MNIVSLVTTYRTTFAEEVRKRGVEGLIALLASKNRQLSGERDTPNSPARKRTTTEIFVPISPA